MARKYGNIKAKCTCGMVEIDNEWYGSIFFTEEMLKLGIPKMLAIKMLEEKTLTVPQAAKIAGLCLIDMFSLASSQGVDVVDYDPKEIDDELAAYYG